MDTIKDQQKIINNYKQQLIQEKQKYFNLEIQVVNNLVDENIELSNRIKYIHREYRKLYAKYKNLLSYI